MMRVKEYSDRQKNANDAKSVLLEKFKKALAEPSLVMKMAERTETARLRDIRHAAREAEKLVTQQNAAAAAAALCEKEKQRSAAESEATHAKKAAQAERLANVFSAEAASKAARDLRYAKRKAAQMTP